MNAQKVRIAQFEPKVLDARLLHIGIGTVVGTAMVVPLYALLFGGGLKGFAALAIYALLVAVAVILAKCVPSLLLWVVVSSSLRRQDRSARKVATLTAGIVAFIGAAIVGLALFLMGLELRACAVATTVGLVPAGLAMLLARRLFPENGEAISQ